MPAYERLSRTLTSDPTALARSVLRLSGQGGGVGSIAAYAARSEANVLRDLARWEQCGFEVLGDAPALVNSSCVSAEVRAFVQERLRRSEPGTPLRLPRRSGRASGF